jgi:hypothetical protein
VNIDNAVRGRWFQLSSPANAGIHSLCNIYSALQQMTFRNNRGR